MRRETESPPIPSNRGATGVLAVESADSPDGPSALVYYARDRVRRVELLGGRPRYVWKRRLWQAPTRDACARVGDVVVFGGKEGGLEGVRLSSGEHVWLLKHPSRLAAVPVVLDPRRLRVVFDDRTWIELDPRSGKLLRSGTMRSDHGASQLAAEGAPPAGVFRRLMRTADGHRIVGEAIAARDGRRLVPPGWAVAAIEPAGGHIVAALRSTEEPAHLGAAIVHVDRFELDGLLDLGAWDGDERLDGTSSVDDCVQIRLGDRVHVIDPIGRRELFRLDERGATMLPNAGQPIRWRGR